MQRD
jgi:hypothetical protein